RNSASPMKNSTTMLAASVNSLCGTILLPIVLTTPRPSVHPPRKKQIVISAAAPIAETDRLPTAGPKATPIFEPPILNPTNAATASPTTRSASTISHGKKHDNLKASFLPTHPGGVSRLETEPTVMVPAFEVIPAVDIEDGRAVQLVGGERDSATEYGDPIEAAERWVDAGAQTLHLVDLDGAFDGERENETAIERIVETVEIPVKLGGGIRTAADARGLLDSGIDRVILGTAALENPDLVADID